MREAMTRSGGGSVVIYAIGSQAVLAVIGDEGLDITMLHRRSQATLDAIRILLEGVPTAGLGDLGGQICRLACAQAGRAGSPYSIPGTFARASCQLRRRSCSTAWGTPLPGNQGARRQCPRCLAAQGQGH